MNPVNQSNFSTNYNDIEQMLFQTCEVKDRESLPFNKVEYVFDIFKDSQDFLFDDEDERLSTFLIFTACLYSVKKKEKVCFISPTYYYAQQAAIKRINFLKCLAGTEEDTFSTVVPGMSEFDKCVNGSKVIFMHGKDYTEYLPKGWTGRKIIQIFPGEDVPVDPIRRSACHYCND